mgnify:CR=1 FL=1
MLEDGASIEDIGYLEAHGTGTQIGDRTETEALQRVFGKREKVLPIGSLKSNIGHTEAAAGIGSVIKSILILQHGEIPPTLHCEEKNPNIPFESYKIRPVETAEYIQPANFSHPFQIPSGSLPVAACPAHILPDGRAGYEVCAKVIKSGRWKRQNTYSRQKTGEGI